MTDDHVLVQQFQEQLMQFIRGLGLHRADATPCKYPVSMAEACAMVELMHHEPISQRDLCQALNLEKSTVSRLVVDLEQRGWIQRERSDDDARLQLLRRTESGHQASIEIVQARNQRFGALLERVDPAQRANVVAAMSVLVEALHDEQMATNR
jgi:DNA-binding MarR family transcriptional regulator